jgi:hypothetical protein
MANMSDLTVSLITAGAVVAGALAGQLPTIVNMVITGRRDRTTAQEARRREAYAAFIDATQGIIQSLSGLPPLRKSVQETTTGRALEEVAKLQRAWATVVIVGTVAARAASGEVKAIADRIDHLIQYEQPEDQVAARERMSGCVGELRSACDGFVEVARKEFN